MRLLDLIDDALLMVNALGAMFKRDLCRSGVVLALICVAFPVSGYAADKLVVTNAEGSNTFRVEDDGFVLTKRSLNAQGQAPYLALDETGTGNKSVFLTLDYKWVQLQRHAQSFGAWEGVPVGIHVEAPSISFCIDKTGYVGFGKLPEHPLDMASGAHVTSGGVWTNASSRQYKENIRELTGNEALEALKGMKPVTFNYKQDLQERHVGFIAEDVPELVATSDRKGMSPMDVVAVLTKVVQEQRETIAKLSAKVARLEKCVASVSPDDNRR